MQKFTHTAGWPRIAFLLVLILLSGVWACRRDTDTEAMPNRSKVFADFSVRYLAPEQQLRGQVSFWEGLSWEQLDPIAPEGIVSFEGRRLVAKRLSGGHVRFSDTHYGPYEEPLAFRFRNRDGRYLQYELKMSPIRDFFVKGRISREQGATFVVNGGVMSREESIVFLFSDSRNRATAVTAQGPNADVEVFLSPQQLRDLSPGPYSLYLVKKQHKAESHPGLELTAAVEYYSESRQVSVE